MARLSQILVTALIGSILFAGLPILAWGIADFQGFIAHPARAGYLIITVLLQIVVAAQFPGAGRSSSKGQKLVRQQQVAIVLLQIISLAIVIAIPYTDARDIAVIGEADLLRYLGLGVFALGFLLMNWSAAVLGHQFSTQVTIQEGHQLVTAGPYRLIRHPRYTGILLFNLGIALVFRSWLGLLIVALLALLLLWRIHDEEALMHQQFGADWEAYAGHSRRLVPYIW
ncbi:MAG: isoprenylcysteine carboxylmethyltransferase family protein [Chloroflexi bacterium]|nr:isoprenylcysteine carboxylmethyltransferase family protein [Chloroflexota bacterium]